MAQTLFELPKKPRQWRMRVADAGHGCIQFKCQRCGFDTGWIVDERSVSENKRGLPCPECNKANEAS